MTTDANSSTGIRPPALTRRSKANSGAAVLTAPSKSDTVIKLLLRTRGATPPELIAVSGWQAHSVRAFLSGLRKKGRVIVREARKSGEFSYRIEIAQAAQPPETAVARSAADTANT